MSIAVAQPSQKNGSASFEEAWQRLSHLLEEPSVFAIQFVFSSNYKLHSALLRRLQQTAQRFTVDCLELPKTRIVELDDTGTSTAPSTAHQLAERITRHCLARVFPQAPPHTRLLLLDLHQALPTALAALLCAEPADGERQAILHQALADSRALLLSRLNERRAQLSAFGPLLILLPEDWTKPAAEYAPDLWTMRLSSLYLALPPATGEAQELSAKTTDRTSGESASEPRIAECKILERWQKALRDGQTDRLPIADGWIAANTSARLGQAQEAEKIAEACLALAYQRGSLRDQLVSQGTLGDMRLRLGKLAQASEAYAVALTLAQQIAATEPENLSSQRDLSVSYDKVAAILQRSNPAAALAHYQDSLKIRQTLARREPDNAEWQHDLSVSYDKVGDILQHNDPAAALVHYQDSLKIRQNLARREPDNAEWQHDLSVSYDKVGDILQRSDPAAALAFYQTSLKIAQGLAKREPDNLQTETDLVISYIKLAEFHPILPLADARAYLQAALDTALSLQQRGLLGSDQADWPTEIRQRLEALPSS